MALTLKSCNTSIYSFFTIFWRREHAPTYHVWQPVSDTICSLLVLHLFRWNYWNNFLQQYVLETQRALNYLYCNRSTDNIIALVIFGHLPFKSKAHTEIQSCFFLWSPANNLPMWELSSYAGTAFSTDNLCAAYISIFWHILFSHTVDLQYKKNIF